VGIVVSPSSNVVIWLRRADRVGRAPPPSSTQESTMGIAKIRVAGAFMGFDSSE